MLPKYRDGTEAVEMDFLPSLGTVCCAVSLACATGVQASSHLPLAAHDWQLSRLMAPTPAQLVAERRGQVFIYDALAINEVDAALDAHFDRIQHMMFIRVYHPPEPSGDSGYTEDDGCD